ncbi:S8 family peptidase [Kosakonia cowanii]|uniref:S8 family peptidase n=1 Tax=Kosakonia cowanii TaxID=208223 RepID=UPI00345BFC58
MTESVSNKKKHITLPKTATSSFFKAPSSGGGASEPLPERNRQQHGQTLLNQLQRLKAIAERAREAQIAHTLSSAIGVQVEFIGQPDVALAFESLSDERPRDLSKRIELLSINTEKDVMSANVFIPDGKIAHFERYIQDYLAEKRRADGVSADHKSLINTISAIQLSDINALWTDSISLLPEDPDYSFWWEVWLPVRGNRQAVINDFRKISQTTECQLSEHMVTFPERTVAWMFGSQSDFARAGLLLNCVAELRRAKETADFFAGAAPAEQQLWVGDALGRLQIPEEDEDVPYVCLLDSGVNRAHPLLSPLIHQTDVHTINEAWGNDDRANHGTGLAGIALYGDMFDAMVSQGPLVFSHRLESVKLTPAQGANAGEAREHAWLFSEAVTRPEIFNGQRRRVFSSAVTATDYRDFGRPSAWSAMVDALAVDAQADFSFPRLFVLSAGNIIDRDHWHSYPQSLSINQIHDPAQAWNALTVGAYTKKTESGEADFQAVAVDGGLSPFTSTSALWEGTWPLKPDVVFEGGNAATNGEFTDNFASLELLTTNAAHLRRQFWTTNATSAASALCARMAAQLMAQYPTLRPETIRALITHSARWTPAMLEMYPPNGKKSGYASLIRHCGWGVPDRELAMWSMENSLTLIEENSLRPYHKEGNKIKTCNMNLHALPWPVDELLALQNTAVEMRVTLSYFIEPNPSARGSASKFYYPSHRLQFAVKRPTESLDEFSARINAATETEEPKTAPTGSGKNWLLGTGQRHRGSLHQDIWYGTAAELANCGYLAVFPGQGWWKTRRALERFNSDAPYSLLVSIHTAETNVDLLTPVELKVEELVQSITGIVT